MLERNLWLVIAGSGSAVAALLHLGCMIGGPGWFRFLGAGERFARAAEQGRVMPYAVTVAIAALLSVWAAYAFSAADLLPRLPLLRTGLVLIAAVLLARAAWIFFPSVWLPEHSQTFRVVSSLIVFALGLSFLAGTLKAWPDLSMRT